MLVNSKLGQPVQIPQNSFTPYPTFRLPWSQRCRSAHLSNPFPNPRNNMLPNSICAMRNSQNQRRATWYEFHLHYPEVLAHPCAKVIDGYALTDASSEHMPAWTGASSFQDLAESRVWANLAPVHVGSLMYQPGCIGFKTGLSCLV